MRDMIIHTVFAFTLILLLPPVNDLCREYVAGPHLAQTAPPRTMEAATSQANT